MTTTRNAALVAGAALMVLAGCGPVTAASAPYGPGAVAPSASAPPPEDALRELTSGPIMRSSPPTKVAIPKLKVTSGLIDLGVAADGTMQVPPDADVVGWFTGAPTPGALGPAVLAGHEDWNGKDGAFARLADLSPGDEIIVNRQDGSVAIFAVTKVEQHAKAEFPTDAVYGPIDHAGLRLITCGGAFDVGTHHYQDNIVAFADLRMAKSS